jgi:multidrug efflux system membrane fusion protein
MSREYDEPSGPRRSYIIAAVLLLIVAAWVGSGYLNRGAQDKAGDAKPDAKAEKTIPTVRVRTVSAEQRRASLIVRGQTEALRKVEVRSETAGTVIATPIEKGQSVKTGDLLCQLKVNARQAQLKQAQAQKQQKWLEYDGSKRLSEKGFRSETAVAGDLAEYEGSKAFVEQMETELDNTRLRAPFDGFVDDRRVDIGDYMQPGGVCAVVIDQSPFLVIGQISERDVVGIAQGDVGTAHMVTGETVQGRVRYVSRAADQQTRTFRLELEIANDDGAIRDGVTAEIRIEKGAVEAHRITPAILGLDERGALGVRIIERGNIVRIVPVTIIADGTDGVWVTGLPKRATIITVGQEYVTNGQKVQVVDENAAPPAPAKPPAKTAKGT